MARDPFDFRREGETVYAISGGRTSAYGLYRLLMASGGLPDNVALVFADTGEELPATYAFLNAIEGAWGVQIVRVARPAGQPKTAYAQYAAGVGKSLDALGPTDFLLEDYRAGCERRGVEFSLFGGRARWCSNNLKQRETERWCLANGWNSWLNVVGIRADEPPRVAKMRGKHVARPVYPAGGETWMLGPPPVGIPQDEWCPSIGRVDYDYDVPLADAGITSAEVLAFWRSQSFDLQIPSKCGNCHGCVLKSNHALVLVEIMTPGALDIWARRETYYSRRFRPTRKDDYAALMEQAEKVRRALTPQQLASLINSADDEAARSMLPQDEQTALPCLCHD